MSEKFKRISFENLATFASAMDAEYAHKDELPTRVSELANDAGYQTEEQVSAAINAKGSSAYKAGGSAAFDSLPELSETNLGLVVNATDEFTTTDSFVEGAGFTYPAGTNVAVVQSGETYKYDVLAGFVDLSGYVKTTDFKEISAEDIEALFADD